MIFWNNWIGKLEMFPANASVDAVCLSIFQHISRMKKLLYRSLIFTQPEKNKQKKKNLILLSYWAKKMYVWGSWPLFCVYLSGDLNRCKCGFTFNDKYLCFVQNEVLVRSASEMSKSVAWVVWPVAVLFFPSTFISFLKIIREQGSFSKAIQNVLLQSSLTEVVMKNWHDYFNIFI